MRPLRRVVQQLPLVHCLLIAANLTIIHLQAGLGWAGLGWAGLAPVSGEQSERSSLVLL